MKELNGTQVFDLWNYIAPSSLDTICRKYNIDIDDLDNYVVSIGIFFSRNNHGLQSEHSIKPKRVWIRRSIYKVKSPGYLINIL